MTDGSKFDSRISKIEGKGVPLEGNSIDTDRIIPARFLKTLTFDDLGKVVFVDDREQLKSSGALHPFDVPRFRAARILIVNQNFGCGSSREHAAQAIYRWGIRGIIGESFSEIFFSNGISVGMPCLTASAEVINKIQKVVKDDAELPLHIILDLEAMTVGLNYVKNNDVSEQIESFPVYLPESARQQFLLGTWDATFELLSNADKLRAMHSDLPYPFF
jgi:3-isopropylmalate/(R)-2-methylmalate dehydratase small subunit